MSESERKFVRGLITLSARLKNLQYDVADRDVRALHKEAQACRGELQRLSQYAEAHNIDTTKFRKELDETIDVLIAVEKEIERKEAVSVQSVEAALWLQIRKVMNWILNLLWGWVRAATRVLVQQTLRLLVQKAYPELMAPRDDRGLLTDTGRRP